MTTCAQGAPELRIPGQGTDRGSEVAALRQALAAVAALNKSAVWAGVEIELDELRRRQLGAVLVDVESALGTVGELLERLADAVREFGHMPGEQVDEAISHLWPVAEAIEAASWELDGKGGVLR